MRSETSLGLLAGLVHDSAVCNTHGGQHATSLAYGMYHIESFDALFAWLAYREVSRLLTSPSNIGVNYDM